MVSGRIAKVHSSSQLGLEPCSILQVVKVVQDPPVCLILGRQVAELCSQEGCTNLSEWLSGDVT